MTALTSDAAPSPFEYRKFEVDNAICMRRFHIAYEQGQATLPKQAIDCPHCGARLWEGENLPPAILLREENLVKSPDGSRPLVTECDFLKPR